MDIQDAIHDFIMVHEIDNGSKYTIRDYRKVAGRFAAWLKAEHGITDTDDIALAHLRGWVSFLQKSPLKSDGSLLDDSTVYNYSLVTQVFCHWLEDEGVIDPPITTRFKLPRLTEKFVPTFTHDDVEKLLEACEEGDRDKPRLWKALTARNRAIVSVLIDTGIRRQELVGLRLCDIDRRMMVLTVRRKGGKWQQVPISREGFKALHGYLKKHRSFLAASNGETVARKEDRVFLADDGKPLTISGVSKLFGRLQKRTGIEGKRVSPHNCRRYMATMQLAMGRSEIDVMRQMGHTALNMTKRYASLTIDHLRRSHEKYSPLRAKRMLEEFRESGGEYWDEE